MELVFDGRHDHVVKSQHFAVFGRFENTDTLKRRLHIKEDVASKTQRKRLVFVFIGEPHIAGIEIWVAPFGCFFAGTGDIEVVAGE